MSCSKGRNLSVIRESSKFKLNHFRFTKATLILLFAILICTQISSAADWPMYYQDAKHSALDPANGAKTDNVRWEFEIGKSTDLPDSRGMNHSFAMAPPAIAHETVYIHSSDDYLYAVDANNGKLRWKFNTIGHASDISSAPAIAEGVVFFGTGYYSDIDSGYNPKGYFYALDAATGKLKWDYPTEHCADSSPVVDNGIVYFGSDGIYALDTQNGKLKWKYNTSGIIGSPLLISGDNLYYPDYCSDAFPHGVCINALDVDTGKLKWKQAISGEETGIELLSLLSANGLVIIANPEKTGYVYALDALDGDIKWSSELYLQNALFISDGILYVNAINEKVSNAERFKACLLVDGENIPVFDGGDVGGVSAIPVMAVNAYKRRFVYLPFRKHFMILHASTRYITRGNIMLSITLTENGGDKLRNAVIKYHVPDSNSLYMIMYLDENIVNQAPISPSLAYSIEVMPMRNILINFGTDIENKTKAEELIKIFDRNTNGVVGLDIYSGEFVQVTNSIYLSEYGELSFSDVAYVDGITYKYSGFPPNYLYAIGEKVSTETHPDDSESVGGFEGVLLGIILLVLYVFRAKHFEE